VPAPTLSWVALALLCAGPCGIARAAQNNLCEQPAGPVAIGTADWNGWGQDFDNSRYQSEPAMRAIDVTKLGVKWAFGVDAGAALSQPAIVDGRLFVASSLGRVYALDARTGCTYWTFDAAARIRTGVSIGELGRPPQATRLKRVKAKLAHLDVVKGPSAVFFGDDGGAVYALDAQKGTLLWRIQVDTHPLARIAGTPVPYQTRLYVAVSSDEAAESAKPNYACCTFRGSVAALEMASGRVLWKTYTVTDGAGAAISTSPTIDPKRNALYVGTGNSFGAAHAPMADAIVALDLIDGRVRWIEQPPAQANSAAAGFSSAPILRSLPNGNPILLAAEDSGAVFGLDPDRAGEVLWQVKANDAVAGNVQLGAAADHRNLYVSVNSPAGIAALEIKTGARRWYTSVPAPACAWTDHSCSHAPSAAVAVMPGIAFCGSMDGHLRAYSSIDGKVVWDFDTAKDFDTVNRVAARGGSLDYGGASIVEGIIYAYSGYPRAPGQPGNVLLAFSANGK
jgi:polyvinyl alcohol dehydrogenase (cytochrome)